MKNRLSRWLLVSAGVGLSLAGCQHSSCYRPAACATSYASFPEGATRLPGGEVPQFITQAPLRPTPVPFERQRYLPPTAVPGHSNWRPAVESGARLMVPQNAQAEEPRASVRLQPPESEPPAAVKPAAVNEPAATSLFPSGIAQFGKIKDDVTSGLKPLLDGLDWLKENGYRTVLHLRPPGNDDAADRRQVEMRGMNYVSLEVSPATLARNVMDEFNRLVGDAASYPLFVYDHDGSLAGGLWYLHARTVDRATDEEARIRASRLGLKVNQNGEHREMWLAIQEYLKKNPNMKGL